MYKECDCGSHKHRYELHDAAGIFCCFVCEDCEENKRKKYNPNIFNPNSRYAMSGKEEDIFVDTEYDYNDD